MCAADAEPRRAPGARSLVIPAEADDLGSVSEADLPATDAMPPGGSAAWSDGGTLVELHDGGEVVERRRVEPTWAALEEQIADMLVNTPWVRSRDLVPWARRLIRLRRQLDDALEEAGQEPRR